MSKKCQAKNPNNCRYHTPQEHALQRYETAYEKFNDIIRVNWNQVDAKFGSHAAFFYERDLAKAELEEATAAQDILHLPEINEQMKTMEGTAAQYGPKYKELKERKTAAENLRDFHSPKTVQARNKKFEEIKQNLATQNSKTSKGDWRESYNKAVAELIANQGNIINSSGHESYGLYVQDRNVLKTHHLKQCGTLTVNDITEHSKYINNFDSMNPGDPGQYQQYLVQGKATCKCGEVCDETIEVEGTLGGLLDQLLKK